MQYVMDENGSFVPAPPRKALAGVEEHRDPCQTGCGRKALRNDTFCGRCAPVRVFWEDPEPGDEEMREWIVETSAPGWLENVVSKVKTAADGFGA